jgi:hypothetical protein
MANHVYFNIDLSLDAGQTELVEKLGNSCRVAQGEMQWINYEVEKLPIYPVPYNEKDWYGWGCEQMGAKWISVDDWNEHYISGHSAWSPPIPFLTNLIQHIYDQVGGIPSAKMTYEDEFRNFVGVCEVWIDIEDSGKVNWDFQEAEGSEFIECMEEWSGWNTNDENFEWWEVKLVQGGGHYEPQEVIDDMVYGFFEDQKVMVRHD